MVIISSLHNYDIDDIHTFNQSLNSVGYGGEKIMIVYNCKESVKRYLKNSGWVIYQKNLDDTQVVTKRFEDISDILKEYDNDEYVLVTDCRDVYFNKNIELFTPIDLYIGVDGNYPLKNHIWATKEMLKAYPNEYEMLQTKPHLCAGVIFGKNKKIISLCKDVYEYTFKSEITDKKSTVDQMALNVLVYKKYNYIPTNNTLVINLGCTEWNYSDSFYIYHQYDRFKNFWKYINKNFKKTIL